MIHYHGLPITPNSSALVALDGGHAFISFLRPDQFALTLEVCQSFAVDNGAFSSWKAGKPVTDWKRYYEWVAGIHNYPSFDFAVIPDVIDGSEGDNDDLIDEWAWSGRVNRSVGAPVWHLHESLDRLARLAQDWPRVCLGSSGEYSTPGSQLWWSRMNEAMSAVCNKEGLPICKLHGLRMLDPEIFTNLPLASADSANIARSVGIDSKWKGSYTPVSKEARAWILRQRIEREQSQIYWEKQPIQECLLENPLDE